MHLTRLNVSSVRNLKSVQIEPATGINYFYGDNGAGKTSLLEAVSLLSVGRSFRSGKITTIINNDNTDLTISGTVFDDLRETSCQVGISRQKDSMAARIDGQNINRLSELATAVPIVVILDWILFHVKPSYVNLSRRYKVALSQRNAALRSGSSLDMVNAWNKELAETGELIAQQRHEANEQVQQCLQGFTDHLPLVSILPEMHYRRGWAEGQSLIDNLESAIDNCRRLGSTSTGPHRADIKLKVGADEVRYMHSRGQQKLLAILLKLAQVDLYTKHHQQAPILLFDDLPSELDDKAREFVFSYLESTSVQVFLTGVERISKTVHSVNKTFHVERGEIENVI